MFKAIVLEESEGKVGASIRLHEAFGFTHAGNIRSVGFKFGRWVDSVLMQLPLGEGNETLPGED